MIGASISTKMLFDGPTLMRWFGTFENTSQSAIFVGEAPGRDGGAITGIPFVSPKVLTSGDDPWGEFGCGNVGMSCRSGKMRIIGSGLQRGFGSMFRRVFSDLPRPLTWNIYPFWPFAVVGNDRRDQSGTD